jgi:hypothetical protein
MAVQGLAIRLFGVALQAAHDDFVSSLEIEETHEPHRFQHYCDTNTIAE